MINTNNAEPSMPMSKNIIEKPIPAVHHEIDTEDEEILKMMLTRGVGLEYINNEGNKGIMNPLTVDSSGKVVGDNVVHSLDGVPVGAYIIEGDPPPPPPAVAANLSSSGSGDPHFVGLNGTHFEFQGIPGNVFNLLSDARIQVNALFSRYSDYATVMAQIGVLIGKNRDHVLVNPGGGVSVNGQGLSSGQTAKLKEGTVSLSGDTATISTKEYSMAIYNRGGYLDIGIATTSEGVNRDEVMPNGVIGQTASGHLNQSYGSFLVHDGIFGTNVASNVFGAKTKIDKLKDSIMEKYNLT